MPRSRPHPLRRIGTVLGAAAVALTSLAVPAAATPSYCGLTWGSLPESASTLTTGTVEDVRAGRHQCFDRLVVDLDQPAGADTGYTVRYVSQFTEDGSGRPVPLRGTDLQITINAPAYEDGRATYVPANRTEVVPVSGFNTFRQVAWGGSYEGYTTLGLGVRARLPFRVFVLDDPDGARVVIDVAHYW